MKKTLLNEVRQLQKIAGILKENSNVEYQGDIYDMADGIGLPYDGGKMANKFKQVGEQLGMREGVDFKFGYEAGDTPEDADPSYIEILNPKMQDDPTVRKMVLQCIEQYD